MKFVIQIFFLVFILLQSCKPDNSHTKNYIDTLETNKQVEDFIVTIDASYKGFKIIDTLPEIGYSICKHISDSLGVKYFTKADFDNNGLTDILVVGNFYGKSILCILDTGNYKYTIKNITRGNSMDCKIALVKQKDSLDMIEYYYRDYFRNYESVENPFDLYKKYLVYKFGDFIELNKKTSRHKIEKIEFFTTSCYGTCPVYDLDIKSDKSAVFNAKRFNEINSREVTGVYKTIITDKEYFKIIELINYIDFVNLENKYSVGGTDNQTSTLKITYDNGKIKSIHDYGLIGTFGLNRVYQLIYYLRNNQKWTQ